MAPMEDCIEVADGVELTCVLHPQPGYPWRLDLQVGYRLDGTGLTVSIRARNASSVPAPFGIGFHPYLTVGTAIDDAVLQIPATRCLVMDDRGLPIGNEPVAGSDLDFTEPRSVGSMRLDTGYTDLVRGSEASRAHSWRGPTRVVVSAFGPIRCSDTSWCTRATSWKPYRDDDALLRSSR